MRALIIIAALLMVGCSTTTVEEEVHDYCTCVSEKGDSNDPECVKKADAILLKYEFDPEASQYIEKEIEKCLK